MAWHILDFAAPYVWPAWKACRDDVNYAAMAQRVILDCLVGPDRKNSILGPQVYVENLLQKRSGFDAKDARVYLKEAQEHFIY